MSYTLTMLTTKADCTALINIASAEKADALYKKQGLERQSQSASSTSMEIAANLAAVNSELEALETILANLPPGPTYDQNLVKKKKADYKKFLLEQRQINFGPIAVVEKQYDIACLTETLAETDAFIVALEAKRDELPA